MHEKNTEVGTKKRDQYESFVQDKTWTEEKSIFIHNKGIKREEI